MHELAVLVLHIVLRHHHVLNPDAMAALHIDARLIGDIHALLDHSLRSSLRVLPGQPLRALMYVQDIAHAVPGAAFIVHPHIPDGLPCQDVQIPPGASVEPSGIGHLQHARRHCRVMPLDFIGNGPQHNRPGHVRGSPQVLPAGIHQEQPLRRKHRMTLRCGLVVHHGRVGLVAADGGEGQPQELRYLTAKSFQLVRSGDLRDLRLPDVLLQPVDELRQGQAVL